MSEIKEDKLIEEHIRQLFKDYKVQFSDEQKNEMLHLFQKIKLHNNRVNFSLKEIIQNKAVQFIILSIVSIFILIYIYGKFFPAEQSDNTQQPSQENASSFANDTITTKSISSDSASTKNHAFNDSNQVQNSSTVTTIEKQSSANQLTEKDSNIIKNKQINTMDSTTISTSKKKKKKKKKIKDSLNMNSQEEPLPVLEPKVNENSNIKEEE